MLFLKLPLIGTFWRFLALFGVFWGGLFISVFVLGIFWRSLALFGPFERWRSFNIFSALWPILRLFFGALWPRRAIYGPDHLLLFWSTDFQDLCLIIRNWTKPLMLNTVCKSSSLMAKLINVRLLLKANQEQQLCSILSFFLRLSRNGRIPLVIVDKSTLSLELPTFLGLCTAICRGRDVNQDLVNKATQASDFCSISFVCRFDTSRYRLNWFFPYVPLLYLR